MAEWLRRAFQGHECTVSDLEAMGLNFGWVELGVHGTYEVPEGSVVKACISGT